ncbi:selenocysteine insertion sequence-binding protein 2 isoform X9 [Herpailurus yagouaroundi]|uniref:selenocysteine insertion sequence-binding protein 2 isoform X9 n=1 Tax=Herpailurus yagouaroundi TaxID=1608482 RepID=UPI001AD7DA24|nr:selenocysteine insertion sequence-binding protein 2 isoform X9 [Puma yagouaroundi]
MASEGPREPAGEGIKLSADVKPFVPKFAGLNVVWSESSEARVFPSCAAPYYPCAQELPGPEQKLYAEDVAFGASAFPPQYLSSELAVHPCGYSPYPVESTPRVCPVPGAPYAYGHPGCYRAFQTPKPRSEQVCALPQDTRAVFKKKTYDEQKFDSKKADGSLPSDLKSGRGSHPTYILADANLKSDGYHRRTDRKSRIIEKSASASKPGFEFTRMDFPELQGPENREIAETRKQPRWGPLRSASADLSLLGEVGEPAAGTAENNFKNSGKKSQVPVQLDLGGMLAALEKKQHAQSARASSKPVVFSVGAVPVLSRDPASGKKGHFSQVKTPHNPLDSSAPLMKKGKQREVPKAKKPTSLKKIILKERQERKQQRLQENAVSPAPASDAALDGESGGDEALDQAEPSEGTEESAAPTPTGQRKSEEPPRTEPQKEADGLCLVPDGAGCPRIHSRRFRDYCSQMLSKEVDACVTDLLRELVRFQDRMYQKDPVKAKTKRRLVLGLREVLKHLKLRKLKCIIISPNCEKIQSKGGLDDTLHTIIGYACEQNIPFVFALNRKALGRSLNKAVPVSVVGIFSYDGAQDQFHRMVELTMAARQAYKTMLENAHQELAGEPGPPAPGSPPPQGPPAPAAGRDKPRYMEIWREHLEAYSRGALELEDSLEASTSQMMNLNL